MKQLGKFDTKVQHLKYKVLREVAKQAWNNTLPENLLDIPKIIVPGKIPTMRCCIYKERAIVAERVKLAMGGNRENPNIIEVIDIACDECPAAGYEVTDSCRGCLAHRCEDVCPKGAISFDHNYVAYIDNEKCIACGACVYQCPFGAIMDKSYILDVIGILRDCEKDKKYKAYAVVAPSVASQFKYAKLGQVIGGLKKLGFHTVVEAALGADMVAYSEAKELAEKGFLTSSCCPAFVSYIKSTFPELVQHISHNLSPMAAISRYIKDTDENAKIVFIGPCTAKKAEIKLDSVKPYVDSVITFEELQALFDSRDIDITQLDEDMLDNASYFGRIFARSGGLADAVEQALKEHGFDDFRLEACVCDGIEQCRIALTKKKVNRQTANFIEGMACEGGCIGGAGCLTHGDRNKSQVDKYGKEAMEKTIYDAISVLNYDK